MLPWKTSRAAAWVLVQFGVQQDPAGTPLPGEAPLASPPHCGHLQQKKNKISHIQGMEDPKTRGFPLLGLLGLVQGKGGCGTPRQGTPAAM